MINEIRRCIGIDGEPAAVCIAAVCLLGGIGWLVAYDIKHSNPIPPTYAAAPPPAEVAAAPNPGDRSPATAIPTQPAAGDRSIAKAEADAARRGDLHDVAVFSDASVELAGRHLVVVTGLFYKNASDHSPMRGWCYLSAGGASPESEITVRLAAKDGDAPVVPANLSQEDATAAGNLPLAALRSAISSCRFL